MLNSKTSLWNDFLFSSHISIWVWFSVAGSELTVSPLWMKDSEMKAEASLFILTFNIAPCVCNNYQQPDVRAVSVWGVWTWPRHDKLYVLVWGEQNRLHLFFFFFSLRTLFDPLKEPHMRLKRYKGICTEDPCSAGLRGCRLLPRTESSVPPCLKVSDRGRRRHVLTDSPAVRVSLGKGAFTCKCQTNSCAKLSAVDGRRQEAALFWHKVKAEVKKSWSYTIRFG